MATRNLVPRADGEGSIGTAAKHWGSGWINETNTDAVMPIGNDNNIGTSNKKWKEGHFEKLVADDVIAKGPVMDVRAFGAVGDGVHDDTTAFKNALSSNYTSVIIPAGAYKITDYVFANNGNFIIDNGTYTVKKPIYPTEGIVKAADDTLYPYPLIFNAHNDGTYSNMSNQGMCTKKTDGVATELYMFNLTNDESLCSIVKHSRMVGADGVPVWSYTSQNYVSGLGHADAQTVIDGYLYALNSAPSLGATKTLYKIDTSTLSVVDTISFAVPNFAKISYDEKNDLICVIWCGWYQGAGETDDYLHFDFYNKSLQKIKSVTATPPRIYDIVQNACAYDGIVYIADCIQSTSEKTFIHCYDFTGKYIKTINICCGAEIEGIDVDDTGYIYTSYNQYCTYGTTYLAACECPLNGNFEDKLRTPVDIPYIQNASIAKDISVYINSPTGTVRDFGIGKGTENNPYTSVAAACLAVQHIANANSSVPIKMIFMHTSQVNIIDGILKLIGITNPLELSHYTYNTMAAANAGPGILFSSTIEGCSDVTIKFIKFYRAVTEKVLTITSSNVRLDGAVFTIDAAYPSYEGLLIKRSHASLVNLIINNGVWRIDFSIITVYPFATITENNNTRDFVANSNVFSKTI